MTHPPKRLAPAHTTAVVAVGLALVATVLAGCSSDGGDATAPDSGNHAATITGMLALVPDTKANRASVVVSLYDVAAKAAHLAKAGDDRPAQLRRLSLLGNDVETGTGLAGGPVVGGSRAAERYDALGYLPSDVQAEVTAGEPPEQTAVGVGRFDADDVLDHAAEVEGSTRTREDGIEVVRWLDDLQVSPKLATPIGDLPAQAGRVLLPADGVLGYTKADEQVQDLVETVTDDHRSLAEDDLLGLVGASLDRLHVHAAYLSTDEVVTNPRIRPRPTTTTTSTTTTSTTSTTAPGDEPTEAPEADEPIPTVLEPYLALGTGASLRNGKPELVVVLVHADASGAKANKKILTNLVATGRSGVTNQPWKAILRRPKIARRGTRVVARFQVDSPTLWRQLVLQQDTLLATS